MQVYVLLGSYDYEGSDVLGLYSSREEAVAALAVFRLGEQCFDSYYLSVRELGGVACSGFDYPSDEMLA